MCILFFNWWFLKIITFAFKCWFALTAIFGLDKSRAWTRLKEKLAVNESIIFLRLGTKAKRNLEEKNCTKLTVHFLAMNYRQATSGNWCDIDHHCTNFPTVLPVKRPKLSILELFSDQIFQYWFPHRTLWHLELNKNTQKLKQKTKIKYTRN